MTDAEREALASQEAAHAWRERAEKAEAEVARLLELLIFAVEMTGEPECYYDHHGYCQAHNLQPKGECWVELARAALRNGEDGE